MRMRTSLETWSAALLATLGLVPVAGCGSATQSTNGQAAPSEGGADNDAGRLDTGGSSGATGGTTSGSGGASGGTGGSATGGSATGGSGHGTGGVGGSTPVDPFPCNDPQPLGGGFFGCAGRFVHRQAPEDCPVIPALTACGTGSTCHADADCAVGGFSRCLPDSTGACQCWNGCRNDADCTGGGSVCQCGPQTSGFPIGACVPAQCTGDADCNGLLCTSAMMPPISGCGDPMFACQTASDTCASDGDCSGSGQCFLPSGGGARSCATLACTTGRPFLVGGECRTAEIESRGDWARAPFAPRLDALTARDRERLGDAWTRIALMEHASIAAFARFTLELLSLGAPPELVEASQRALSDETEHARLAFGLASAYRDRVVGPGPLDVRGTLGGENPLGIVRSAIIEGCVGETVAAAEAAESLEHTTDPAVRALLTRIMNDERRHAELAWRFVRWAFEYGTPELQLAARVGLAEAATRTVEPPEAGNDMARDGTRAHGGDEESVASHGVLPASLRRELARRVVAEIVRPCAAALLAESSTVAKAA